MSNPLVIAHRGASGYLPEHTLPAYAYAYATGADYIEPDLVLTRDGQFICLHDIHLEATTNVAETFPDRGREDGRYYAIDFDLAEIKSLQAHERLPSRFPKAKSTFEIPTFEEMIELIQGLNASTGNVDTSVVGIYPELKQPAWHRAQGQPMEKAFLALVKRYGYTGSDAPIFVQAFELEPLVHMRELGSQLPQIFLLSDTADAQDHLSTAGLAAIAKVAQGIGPSKTLIRKDKNLVQRAHAANLAVHPYTFRADAVGPGYEDIEAELRSFYFDIGVDGLFTDFPDRARAVLDARTDSER